MNAPGVEVKVIGYCGVDSGQLYISDPCYLKHLKQGNGQWNMEYIDRGRANGVKDIVSLPDPTLDNEKNFYTKACESENGEVELGVKVNTTYGDGNYAVNGIFFENELQGIYMSFVDGLEASFDCGDNLGWGE